MNNKKLVFSDTHTHLYLPEFSEDIDVVILRAKEQGVSRFFLPNIDQESLLPLKELVQKDPQSFFPMLGLHPCSVGHGYEADLKKILEFDLGFDPIAIGEIGIDLYWDKTFIEQQKIVFREQIHWAKKKSLPFVVHCREAFSEILEILKSEQDEKLKGIFHCFGGSLEEANQIIELGLYLGIGGVLTYKKSGLQEVIKDIPLKHIVLETDSPYLSPVPFRGKRNESGHIRVIAELLADIKGISIEEVAEVTTNNSKIIFGK